MNKILLIHDKRLDDVIPYALNPWPPNDSWLSLLTLPVHDMIQQLRLGPEPSGAVLDVLLMGSGVLADVGSNLVPVTHDD